MNTLNISIYPDSVPETEFLLNEKFKFQNIKEG